MSHINMSAEELTKELKELTIECNSMKELYEKDISALRNELEKISKSEKIFRIAYMTNPDLININRLSDGMYISVNEGFTRILGYTEEDAIGRTSLDMNIWVNPEERLELVKKLKANGEAKNFETKFLSKDGNIVNGIMSSSLIDLDGVPHILSIIKDITIQNKAKEALAKEQFLINALLNNLSDHVYFKDRDSRFIRINKSLALSFGLEDPAQAEGKTDFDFFTREHAQQAFEDEQTIIKTGQLLNTEEKETHLNRPDTWVSTIKLPLTNNDGNIIGTFGISRDVTKRKLAEEELTQERYLMQTLMDNLPDHIYFKDQASRFLRINKAMAQFNGLTDSNKAKGKSDFDFFTEEHAKQAYDDEQNIIRTGQMLSTVEKETHHNRPDTWVSTIKMPLSDQEGNIIGTFGISRDITKSKLAEEEIKMKNDLLQMINSEKDKFFSIIAHDLRGPLSAFVAATQIITEDIQTITIEEIKDITNNMKSSATNIYGLLENLLEWSRLRRGGIDFIPVKFNLKKKIVECIAILAESARKKGIEILISISDELVVLADSHMFETVIRNLVSNAIKFTNKGGQVSITAGYNNDHIMEIKISDSGIGMAPEFRDRLFKLNEKTNRPGTEGELSTGLGLLLCKDFVEKHNGKLWVESEVGKGSIFSFTIG
ncbi:MAG TPA: PAS domain-containing sensor histidine kinase [Bacteroidales bacterium]